MQNFEYCVPTKVVFGRDTESRCGELVRECGGTHALVVYGGGSAVRSGLLDRCTDSLKAERSVGIDVGYHKSDFICMGIEHNSVFHLIPSFTKSDLTSKCFRF